MNGPTSPYWPTLRLKAERAFAALGNDPIWPLSHVAAKIRTIDLLLAFKSSFRQKIRMARLQKIALFRALTPSEPFVLCDSLDCLECRVERLGAWVMHEQFIPGRNMGDRIDAMSILRELRIMYLLRRYDSYCETRDKEIWTQAVAWAQADAGETEAELMETIAMSIHPKSNESPEQYEQRIREIRRSLKRTVIQ